MLTLRVPVELALLRTVRSGMSCISVLLDWLEMGRNPLCPGDLGDLNDMDQSPKRAAGLGEVAGIAVEAEAAELDR
jgi:hypothetical protein